MSPEDEKRAALLRSAPLNKWIAISEDGSGIVAVADTFGEVSELIDRAGLAGPVIVKTPAEWAPLSLCFSVRIPYRTYPDSHGGELFSVSLDVSVSLPHPGSPRTRSFEAIIDAGASRCVFHSDTGRFIGLDVRSGFREAVQGIGGLTDTYLHDICLHIPGGAAMIGAAFKENLPVAALLGMNGFFEHFKVTFDPATLSCEILRLDRR